MGVDVRFYFRCVAEGCLLVLVFFEHVGEEEGGHSAYDNNDYHDADGEGEFYDGFVALFPIPSTQRRQTLTPTRLLIPNQPPHLITTLPPLLTLRPALAILPIPTTLILTRNSPFHTDIRLHTSTRFPIKLSIFFAVEYVAFTDAPTRFRFICEACRTRILLFFHDAGRITPTCLVIVLVHLERLGHGAQVHPRQDLLLLGAEVFFHLGVRRVVLEAGS